MVKMSTDLLPCPFCGGEAQMEKQLPTGSQPAWTFIDCKRRCRVSPHVGEMSSIGYYEQGTSNFIRCRTDEEASALATERAEQVWNTRAPMPACKE